MEIIFEGHIVTCEEVAGLAVSDQDLLAGPHWLTLSFESVIGVVAIDYPLSVVRIAGMERSLLMTTHCREDRVGLRRAAHIEHFLVKPLVGNDLDLLSEANQVITSKNILLFGTLDDEHIARDRPRLNLGSVNAVRFIYISLPDANISDKVPIDSLIHEHDRITTSEVAISAERPGDRLV